MYVHWSPMSDVISTLSATASYPGICLISEKKALTTVKRGYVRQEWKKAADNKTADLAHLFKTSIKIDIFCCLRYGIV